MKDFYEVRNDIERMFFGYTIPDDICNEVAISTYTIMNAIKDIDGCQYEAILGNLYVIFRKGCDYREFIETMWD